MNMLSNIVGVMLSSLVLVLMVQTIVAAPQQANKADDSYLNIDDAHMVFTDRSALADKQILQSAEFMSFIHQLYRHDADNLAKFDNLYAAQQTY